VNVPFEERFMMYVDLSTLPGYRRVNWVSPFQDLLSWINSEFRVEKFGKDGAVAPRRSVRDPICQR